MKKGRHTDRLLRFIDGTLEPEEEIQLRAEIEHSEDLQAELSRLQQMKSLLQGAASFSSEGALNPFFTDRLMKRLEPPRQQVNQHEDLAFFLSRVFRPVAFAGSVLVLCLAIYNLNQSSSYVSETTATEALFGLPPVNTMSVYDMDVYSVDYSVEPSSLP